MDLYDDLKKLSLEARLLIIDSIYHAKSGHPGGSLSIVEALEYIYHEELRKDIDKFVLSKGHAAPALYAVLAQNGYFDKSELNSLRQTDSFLQGHPNINTPGIDMCSGSLGLGLSTACGMALGAKYLKKDTNVYAMLGDGECQEGQIWEAFHFAVQYHLDNLCILIDWNGLQIDGEISNVMNLNNIDEQLREIGCKVIVIDGHNFEELKNAFSFFHERDGRPTVIRMNTIKGKGVSFMENAVEWHGKAPNDKEYEIAMKELKEAYHG